MLKLITGEVPFYEGEVIPPVYERPAIHEADSLERELIMLGLVSTVNPHKGTVNLIPKTHLEGNDD